MRLRARDQLDKTKYIETNYRGGGFCGFGGVPNGSEHEHDELERGAVHGDLVCTVFCER
jgi:hypothetical protein